MLSAILLLDRSYILQDFHHHHHSIFKCVNQYKQRIKEITPVSQSESVHKSYNMHQFPVLLLCWERCLIIYHPIWMEILQPFSKAQQCSNIREREICSVCARAFNSRIQSHQRPRALFRCWLLLLLLDVYIYSEKSLLVAVLERNFSTRKKKKKKRGSA